MLSELVLSSFLSTLFILAPLFTETILKCLKLSLINNVPNLVPK
jgi:hypothetical protein